MATRIREEKQITMSYEAWIGANVLTIDRYYNRGDFRRANLSIVTLHSNMVRKDREKFSEFVRENRDYYHITPSDIEHFLEPSSLTLLEIKLDNPFWLGHWRSIYRAMIDYFAARGYLFKTRMIEVGQEHDVGVEPEDSGSP